MDAARAPGAAKASIEGYVGDSLYPSLFHTVFAPAWVDALLLREDIAPPRGSAAGGSRPFTYLDLGCGDGLGLIVNAAAHPESRFVGIDAMAGHIERGRTVAADLGIANVELRCATFAEALEQESVEADYVAAQGVLSWISPANRAALLALTAQNIRPGGALVIGYNCQPGWAAMLSFQRLLWRLSLAASGSPTERFEQAYEALKSLSAKGMTSLGAAHVEWLDGLRDRLPAEYFPHEYLNTYWHPLWSTDVIEEISAHGLRFVRSAMPNRLREDFVLKAAQRRALADVEDTLACELAADLYQNCRFRTDLYGKGSLETLDGDTALEARLESWWAARQSPANIEYSASTPAGTIRFDNEAAHAIMERLGDGPARLADLADDGLSPADLLNATDALITAGFVVAVDPPRDLPCEPVNAWIADAEPARINAVLTPFGPMHAQPSAVSRILGDPAERVRYGL